MVPRTRIELVMTGYQPIVIPFNYPGIIGAGSRYRAGLLQFGRLMCIHKHLTRITWWRPTVSNRSSQESCKDSPQPSAAPIILIRQDSNLQSLSCTSNSFHLLCKQGGLRVRLRPSRIPIPYTYHTENSLLRVWGSNPPNH